MRFGECARTIVRAAVSVGIAAAVLTPDTALAGAKDDLKLEVVHHKRVKWSKQVPGYEPFVKFDLKWPSDGLIGGHTAPKTPFIVGAAKGAILTATGVKALKVVNWARTLAMKANTFNDVIPLGFCKGRSGNLRGRWGQLDPRTGFAGVSNPTCYVPLYDGRGWTMDDTTDFDVLVA